MVTTFSNSVSRVTSLDTDISNINSCLPKYGKQLLVELVFYQQTFHRE